jgi:endoglucanase
VLLLLAVGCASRDGTRRDDETSKAEMATLTIGEYQPRAGGKPWAAMKLHVQQLAPQSVKLEKTYDRETFGSGKFKDHSFSVAYGLYGVRLEYLDGEQKLVYRSCPEEDARQHDIKTPNYKFSVKICETNPDKPADPPTPAGEVDIKPESEVSIAPKPGSDGDQPIPEPRPDQSQGGLALWIDPSSQAMIDAQSIQPADGPDARRVRYIGSQATAVWYTEWKDDIAAIVGRHVAAAKAADAHLVVTPYLLPFRDCGQHSSGGVDSQRYRTWIEQVAQGLGDAKVLVVLEPDALAMIDDLRDGKPCLSDDDKRSRLELLQHAVTTLKRNPNARVYLDAGHSAWKSVDFMVDILKRAGVDAADGFAVNVSSFQTTEASIQFGQQIRARLGGKSFVIDTSRNGNGPAAGNEWCNPPGRALGRAPTLRPGVEGVDAFLWVKRPGESDGSCNGGPAAGQWWRDKALELAGNAGIN